jgi:hypothetical protein
MSKLKGIVCDYCELVITPEQQAILEWEISNQQAAWIIHMECSPPLRKLHRSVQDPMWCWKPVRWAN